VRASSAAAVTATAARSRPSSTPKVSAPPSALPTTHWWCTGRVAAGGVLAL
jgi:hypothetical protein